VSWTSIPLCRQKQFNEFNNQSPRACRRIKQRSYETRFRKTPPRRSRFQSLQGYSHHNCKLTEQEFYIPTESTSIHFLKSKLCVGCSKGFEIVDLDNLETQSLLDPADTSLDFVTRKEGAGAAKPIAIYRFNGLFLLCYDEFAFFVNKNGWRAKHDWMVSWEGLPLGCGTSPPYKN
jgi:hypothetical protein